jgi:hypothetical protein
MRLFHAQADHQENLMKKTIAVAALLAATFAAAPVVVPAQAASSYPSKCLVLPLLQADCRAVISENIEEATDATVSVASSTASATTRAVGEVKWPVPMWWDCEPAPAGSGHMYDC